MTGKKEKGTLLTGDRTTGKLHLGHFIGSIRNRVKLQDVYEKSFYMLADVQGLTDNVENPEKIRSGVIEAALDNLACGVDPKKTTFFIQSQVPEIAELTVFFLNLVTLARLKRNPTVKDEMKQKGYGEDVTAGFLIYPVSQAGDILAFRANIVPVGEDQLPHLEQANEIGHKFNSIYGEVFPKITGVTGIKAVGIDGNSKMSKSLGNTINLSDSAEELARKVMLMYTDPGHIHVEDPGKVEGNVVFMYLDIFDPDTAAVADLKAQYEKGGLGDVVIKKRLIGILEELLAPIRERREELAKDPKAIMEILEKGTAHAREVAQATMAEVRRAMKIDYF